MTYYENALYYLKERFDKESVLIQVYIRELLKLLITDKSKTDLVSVYDKLQTQLRSLESLGLTEDKYAAMLFPVVVSSLPSEVLPAWKRSRSNSTEKIEWDISDSYLSSSIQFLRTELESDQRIKLARGTFDFDKNKRCVKNNGFSSVPMAADLHTSYKSFNDDNTHKSKKSHLWICEEGYSSGSCNGATSMSLEARKNVIIKKGGVICLPT